MPDQHNPVTLRLPGQLIVDEHSNLWLADSGNRRVLGATRTGRVHTVIAADDLVAPRALALARAADTKSPATLYIADSDRCQIWRVALAPFDSLTAAVRAQPHTPQPRLIAGVGAAPAAALPSARAPAADIALPQPSALAVDDEAGLLYVAFPEAKTIGVFDLDTGLIEAYPLAAAPAQADAPAASPLRRPHGLALAPDRTRLYIADADAVLHLDLRARTMTTLASGTTDPLAPCDVAVSPAGLLVTDTDAHSLRGINLRHGTVVTIWRSQGDDALRDPIGVDFDRHDRSYLVVDGGNDRLLRITRDASSATPLSLTL